MRLQEGCQGLPLTRGTFQQMILLKHGAQMGPCDLPDQ